MSRKCVQPSRHLDHGDGVVWGWSSCYPICLLWWPLQVTLSLGTTSFSVGKVFRRPGEI